MLKIVRTTSRRDPATGEKIRRPLLTRGPFQTDCLDRDGAKLRYLAIVLEPQTLAIFFKGTRTRYRVGYRKLLTWLAAQHAAAEAARKKELRAKKRAERKGVDFKPRRRATSVRRGVLAGVGQ